MAFAAEESGLLGSQALVARPADPARQHRRHPQPRRDEPLWQDPRRRPRSGLDQSSLGQVFGRAAAAEGLRVTTNRGCAASRGLYFRSDHFPFARAGVPGTITREWRRDFVGRPAGWGTAAEETNTPPSGTTSPATRFSPGSPMTVLYNSFASSFGQQWQSASAPTQPIWNQDSEFREAGRATDRSGTDGRSLRRPSRLALSLRAACACPPSLQERFWNCPSQHRIPLTWLLENAGASIRYRTLTELAPAGYASPEVIEAAHLAVTESKTALGGRQEAEGHRGLGRQPARPGTVGSPGHQGRRHDSAVPPPAPARVASRQPALQAGRSGALPAALPGRGPVAAVRVPEAGEGRARGGGLGARGSCARPRRRALAEAGYAEDPRLRGAGHKIANAISQFLRSPLAEKPFLKSGKQIVLHPEAHPPSWYSVAMLASMPNLQRERAGFTERLGHYLAQPAPKKAFVIQVGKKTVKPQHLLLGDPIEADRKGCPKDIPLALHYIELLARMGALQWAPVATKVLARLLKDCDETGIWRPKNLRSQPKAGNKISLPLLPAACRTPRRSRVGRRMSPSGWPSSRKTAGLDARLPLRLAALRQRSSTNYSHARLDLTRSDSPRPRASSTRFSSPAAREPATPLPGAPDWREPTPTARWKAWSPREPPGPTRGGRGGTDPSRPPRSSPGSPTTTGWRSSG